MVIPDFMTSRSMELSAVINASFRLAIQRLGSPQETGSEASTTSATEITWGKPSLCLSS